MTPFFDLIEELRSLGGAPKVTYPTGDNNYPRTERTIKAKRGAHILSLGSAEPDAVRFPNNILTEQVELRSDAQMVEVYRKYEVLPGPFTKKGQEYDPLFGFLMEYTAGEVKNGAAQGTATSDVTPENYIKSELKTYTVPTAALDSFFLTFPGTENIEFPKVLTGIEMTWDQAGGDGSYTENGTCIAALVPFSINLSAEGQGQGSASVLGELNPIFAPQPPPNLPVMDYFFFLPNPVTLSAVLTRASAIATAIAGGTATTVNAWPVFKEQVETFIVVGQKASATCRAVARCAVSISNSSSGSQVNSAGQGSSLDVASTVRAITLPPCIHGAVAVGGGGATAAKTQTASASAVIPSNVVWIGASATPTAVPASAIGYVVPTSISPTPIAALPASGLYLYKPDVTAYKWGYSTVRARIFDFATIA